MARQIFDDGTWIEQDASGNVTSYSDTNGSTFTPDRTVFTQFINSVLGGLSGAINRSLAPKVVASAQPAGNSLVMLALLAGAAYLIFKAAA